MNHWSTDLRSNYQYGVFIYPHCTYHRSAYDARYWWAGLTHCVCRLDKSLINTQKRQVTHESRHLSTLLPPYTS